MSSEERVLDRLAADPVRERPTRFEQAFERLYPRLYGLAYRLLGDSLEAEDLLQETFLRLAGAPVLHRSDEEVAAWLRRVCLNLGANRLRDRQRARARLERAGHLELGERREPPDEPGQLALRQESRTEVRRALARLPDQHRDCLLLRYSGYSYAEIAATLGLAVGSVGVLLARAERAFREVYEEQAHDPRHNGLP